MTAGPSDYGGQIGQQWQQQLNPQLVHQDVPEERYHTL